MKKITCSESKGLKNKPVKPIAKKCEKCSKEADITLAYGPQYYCAEHFTQLVEKRVKKTIRKFELIPKDEKILLAVSGGKDSVVLLHLIAKNFSKTNDLQALIIDEGIPSYRSNSVEIAKKNCKLVDVPFKVVSFKDEFGYTLEELLIKRSKIPKNLGSSCSLCGILRRKIMNSYAKKLNADKLATGHNLDDEAQSIAMNFFNNDYSRFIRLSPKTGIKAFKGFIPRIKPLYEIPEKEIIAFSHFKGIETYSDDCCPYSSEAKRNDYRFILNHLEEKHPGTKHSIIASFLNLREKLMEHEKPPKNLGFCEECGEPSNTSLCPACRKLNEILKS